MPQGKGIYRVILIIVGFDRFVTIFAWNVSAIVELIGKIVLN